MYKTHTLMINCCCTTLVLKLCYAVLCLLIEIKLSSVIGIRSFMRHVQKKYTSIYLLSTKPFYIYVFCTATASELIGVLIVYYS